MRLKGEGRTTAPNRRISWRHPLSAPHQQHLNVDFYQQNGKARVRSEIDERCTYRFLHAEALSAHKKRPLKSRIRRVAIRRATIRHPPPSPRDADQTSAPAPKRKFPENFQHFSRFRSSHPSLVTYTGVCCPCCGLASKRCKPENGRKHVVPDCRARQDSFQRGKLQASDTGEIDVRAYQCLVFSDTS